MADETGAQFVLKLKQELRELLWSQIPVEARPHTIEIRRWLMCSEQQALALYAEYFEHLSVDWMIDRLIQLGCTGTVGSGVDVIFELKLFPAPKL